MSVSGIGSGSASSLFQQRRQDLNDIISAVQAGDMAGARQMLTTYQQGTAKVQAGAGAGERTGVRPVSPLKHDLSALIGSIRSGDAASARTAIAALQPAASQPDAVAASPPGLDGDFDALLQAVQSKKPAGATAAPSEPQIAAPDPTGAGRSATPDDLFARVLAAYQSSGSTGV